MTTITRIFDILPYVKEKYPGKSDILACKIDGAWKKYSIDDYTNYSNLVSHGLLSMGIKKGDKVVMISNSIPEWNFLDMGLLQIGAINVPIYPTLSESDQKYMINHCDADYIFVNGKDMVARVEQLLPECNRIKKVYSLLPTAGYESLYDIMEAGKTHQQKFDLEEIKQSIDKDDIATIIYTSGTTGVSKGVMLSHYNIVSNFLGVANILPMCEHSKALSYLPLCHIYERMMIYTYQYSGLGIYYAENIARIVDNMKEVQPSIMCSVPRLFEKMMNKIMATGNKLTGIAKIVFFWAVKLAEQYEYDGAKGFMYELKRKIAYNLVYKKWRDAIGGNIAVIVSGGAALNERLCRMYTCAKMVVYQGYGLTETSPVIAVTAFRKGCYGYGSTGGILPAVKVKIADDGEILTKGPSLMKGYYKNPDLTKETIDEQGWFHTGDIGKIEDETLLFITGRKKSFFKNSFGKYINPVVVETLLTESEFIDNAIVVGEGQKYTAALIVPNFAELHKWCKDNAMTFSSNKDMVEDKRVINMYRGIIFEINKNLSSTEKVSNFRLMATEWTVITGELSATLKVRRNMVIDRYKDLINSMFN